MSAPPIASFKLRFHERRVRVVPERDGRGCPFSGPGVDLVESEADPVLEAAAPIAAVLTSIEPGARLRSVSIDVRARRALATLEPGPGDERPRVVRVPEGFLLDRIVEASLVAAEVAWPLVLRAIERRRA